MLRISLFDVDPKYLRLYIMVVLKQPGVKLIGHVRILIIHTKARQICTRVDAVKTFKVNFNL